MAERTAEGGGSFPYLNTLLVLLTLVGGVWLVSSKLTSTRPAGVAGTVGDFPHEQTMESRLWEDPFKTRARPGDPSHLPVTTPHELRKLIQAQAGERKDVLILPVMIPGGLYSEDQETRIRSRFAIASALSQSSYVPDDPEHMGAVTLPWPTTQDITQLESRLERSTKDPQRWLVEWWAQHTTGLDPTTATAATRLDLRFEWYGLLPSFETPSNPGPPRLPRVLVLWLNERYFMDKPLLHLPLLLAPIIEALREPKSMSRDQRVALIGPGRSSTLRRMLPELEIERKPPENPSQGNNAKILQSIKASEILKNIEVYSATARAMDKTLVPDSHDAQPRGSFDKILRETVGFKSFRNFAATDDQLASETLRELALRDVDVTELHNHLVLLSEGDLFYSQVLPQTYAKALDQANRVKQQNPQSARRSHFLGFFAFLDKQLSRWLLLLSENLAASIYPGAAKRQGRENSQAESSPDDCIGKFIVNQEPRNLHSFVYLRGLDGQTVEKDSGAARSSGSEDPKRTNLASLEEIRKWSPDANKAEGPAQFDYLSRLGGQLADLEKQLRQCDNHHIKAIGIVGTDVYDILLILQALRHQFPNALFFTTDLDARFWHPREQAWSRNLLVTSGYGLSLHPELQTSVPPFRDSIQTAQFAAALAALEYKGWPTLGCFPPRRFEIAKNGPVDLSVQSVSSNCPRPWIPLHPETSRTMESSLRSITTWPWGGICAVGTIALLGLTCFFRPLRRLTWAATRFQAEVLYYGEEDVGGPEGALTLVWRLQALTHEQKDCLSRWLVGACNSTKRGMSRQRPPTEALQQEEQRGGGLPANDTTVSLDRLEKAKQSLVKAQQEALRGINRDKEAQLRCVIDFLNGLLHRRCWWPTQQGRNPVLRASLRQLRQGRRVLDAWLQQSVKEPLQSRASMDRHAQKNIQHTAQDAREASRKLYTLRRRWTCLFWILAALVVALGYWLGCDIWQDTFHNPEGEPFSLTTGTSVWPAEILRFVAFTLAIGFSLYSYYGFRSMIYQLTRRFRLPLFSSSDSPNDDSKGCESLTVPIDGSSQRFTCRTMRRWPWFVSIFVLPPSPEPGAVVDASTLWKTYQQYGIVWRRLCRTLVLFLCYVGFWAGIWQLSHPDILQPVRGPVAKGWDFRLLLLMAVPSFLFLTFWTIDAAHACWWFIRHLSAAPTVYPLATTDHFSRLRGDVEKRYLDEWIDLQLIAELTERVGRLVYYPSIVFFLLLLARNAWWDRWPWPWLLITLFVCNFLLAVTSIGILQNAARKAKRDAEATLEAKVHRLQAITAESQEKNNANQAEKLLEEIRRLRRGAFVPIWENPILGAVLLPSSGTAVFQLLIWLMGR